MPSARVVDRWSVALIAFGGVVFALAVATHAAEIVALNGLVGPVSAFLLDGVPPLGLIYAGYRLTGTDFAVGNRARVVAASALGAALFGVVIGVTFIVRAVEARPVSEPVFPILTAVGAGAIAGFLAGYFQARARTDARRAKEASEALAFVNSIIRHDLRNDLNTIQMRAGLLESPTGTTDDEASGDDQVATEAERIRSKAEEAAERLAESRAIADTVAGEADLEPVDLADIAREAAGRFADIDPVAVETDIPETAFVRATAGLRSVVDNLIENAVEHNHADEPRVEVTVQERDGTVELRVADNGPGMGPAERAVLTGWGPSAETEGGLVLVRRLVEAFGGDVRVHENDPRGTVVVVSLAAAEHRAS